MTNGSKPTLTTKHVTTYAALIILFYGLSGTSSAANGLSGFADLRWQYRVIVLAPSAGPTALAKLRAAAARVDERDLVWFALGQLDSNYPGVISAAFWAAAEQRLARAAAEGNSEALLIGKDGGDKQAQGRFDLDALFAAIDAMPMRRQERRQGSVD